MVVYRHLPQASKCASAPGALTPSSDTTLLCETKTKTSHVQPQIPTVTGTKACPGWCLPHACLTGLQSYSDTILLTEALHHSACMVSVSEAADLSESRASLDWSTYMVFTVLPTTSSPLSGCSWPTSILNSVDLPAPLAPMMPAGKENVFMPLGVIMGTQGQPGVNSGAARGQPRGSPGSAMPAPTTAATATPSQYAIAAVHEAHQALSLRMIQLCVPSIDSNYSAWSVGPCGDVLFATDGRRASCF